jgi:hypothetical protein
MANMSTTSTKKSNGLPFMLPPCSATIVAAGRIALVRVPGAVRRRTANARFRWTASRAGVDRACRAE